MADSTHCPVADIITSTRDWKSSFCGAANRVGRDHANQFGGRSMVIDPLGQIIAQASETDEALLIVTIDTADENAVRGQIPVFRDRRPELYD